MLYGSPPASYSTSPGYWVIASRRPSRSRCAPVSLRFWWQLSSTSWRFKKLPSPYCLPPNRRRRRWGRKVQRSKTLAETWCVRSSLPRLPLRGQCQTIPTCPAHRDLPEIGSRRTRFGGATGLAAPDGSPEAEFEPTAVSRKRRQSSPRRRPTQRKAWCFSRQPDDFGPEAKL
jgi:hypothetical protein